MSSKTKWFKYEDEIIAYLLERLSAWEHDGRKPALTYFTSSIERAVATLLERARANGRAAGLEEAAKLMEENGEHFFKSSEPEKGMQLGAEARHIRELTWMDLYKEVRAHEHEPLPLGGHAINLITGDTWGNLFGEQSTSPTPIVPDAEIIRKQQATIDDLRHQVRQLRLEGGIDKQIAAERDGFRDQLEEIRKLNVNLTNERNEMHRRAQKSEGAEARVDRLRRNHEATLVYARKGCMWRVQVYRKHYRDAVEQLRVAGVPDHVEGHEGNPLCRQGRADVLIERLVAERDASRLRAEKAESALLRTGEFNDAIAKWRRLSEDERNYFIEKSSEIYNRIGTTPVGENGLSVAFVARDLLLLAGKI